MPSQDQNAKSREESINNRQEDAQPQQKMLPKWLGRLNVHDLQVLFRCWAAVWVTMLLVFIQPTLNHIGLATFFASIALFIAPPAGILSVYLLAALSQLLGMCLAWCWGLVTMKAAFAARPKSATEARLAALQEQAMAMANQTGQPVTDEAQVLIHNGFMLDARVTVIFYVMGCLGIYALCRLRCANPKFILTQIFGMIVTDLFILIGPTLPQFMGDLASVLVEPGAIGVGIGTACSLLLFPQSASCVVLGHLEKLIRMTDTALHFTRERLDDRTIPLATLKATRGGMIGLYKAAQPAITFLPLDCSRGRWNVDDLRGLHDRTREVMYGGLYLCDFHIARAIAATKEEEASASKSSGNNVVGAITDKEGYQIGRRHRLETATLLNSLRQLENGKMRARMKKTMQHTTSDVLQLGSESVKLAADYIRAVNSSRWIWKPSAVRFEELMRDLQRTLSDLRDAKESCIANSTKGVLDNHAEVFDENGVLKPEAGPDRPFLRSMVVSMVIEERILGMIGPIEKLLEYILQLARTRTTQQIWVPSGIQYVISWIFNGRQEISVPGASNEENPDNPTEPFTFESQAQELHRQLKISRGYHGSTASRRNKFTRALIATIHWLFNHDGMFAMRAVIATIATSIPASLPHTAGFFYREKGIWAVISAQTCLLVYMADFSFSLVARGLGTIIGGVMGMAAWYIGSGSGPGNPYGMGAISAFMIMVLIWWRLFLPPKFTTAAIMGGATFALVVGFSWDESHIDQYGLPGKGYEAFWKRLVTVLIGFAASLIVQLFPHPPSTTNHVSKTLANSVRTLSDHYALLISHWGRPEKNTALGTVTRQVSIKVAEILLSLNAPIGLVKFEVSFGPFDLATLKKTQEQCEYINQALGGLLNQAASLPVELQHRLIRVMGILDDRCIGDIMAVLGIIEQSLRTGSPLPERLPAPLVSRAANQHIFQEPESLLTTALIKNDSYRQYCVAVTLYLKFLTSIDDLLLVLKGALGERHVIYQLEDV